MHQEPFPVTSVPPPLTHQGCTSFRCDPRLRTQHHLPPAPPKHEEETSETGGCPIPMTMNSLPSQTLSGNVSKQVLTGSRQPNLEDLNLRMISWRVAATTKYSCFNRSSFPSKNCKTALLWHPPASQQLQDSDGLEGSAFVCSYLPGVILIPPGARSGALLMVAVWRTYKSKPACLDSKACVSTLSTRSPSYKASGLSVRGTSPGMRSAIATQNQSSRQTPGDTRCGRLIEVLECI